VRWGGNAYDLYRDQVLFPAMACGKTLALNIPGEIARKISKNGKDALNGADLDYLPPIWERGSPAYFSRFSEAMAGHATPEQLENFFWAQSLWDDTMAWNIWRHRQTTTADALVVIVGEFHVEYGLGLPDRLKRYGVNQVRTMVQTEVEEWSEEDLAQAVANDAQYGARADYVWVYSP
jgi:uncharacterized iron-regulated protein